MPLFSCAGTAAELVNKLRELNMKLSKMLLILIGTCTVFSTGLQAGEVRIVDVKVRCQVDCTFSVTLEHADTGWEHYANQWDVVSLDGKIIKSRVLYHPHENETTFHSVPVRVFRLRRMLSR